ncbi:nucleoporin Nup43-like [Artemia franciscana]|uniref:Nucleoporin Nup43 n=2 Tax=Artemia franciscana TaxID=6661 RepID=A0AA88HUZ0_ARTSF|nr:hypothetical protein QYM36_010240 [Artemia franciscana]KAK2715593.1 hypothetical protein QYM36_010240 [Artemia franciscana]
MAAKFVSRKVSKVRFQPGSFFDIGTFLSGSADEKTNSIDLWNISAKIDESFDFVNRSSLPVLGDVTELQWINNSLFCFSTSSGNIILASVDTDNSSIKEKNNWKGLHRIGSKSVPCTGFASLVNHLVTVGEDSRICVIQEDRHRPIREFISSDLCSISCIIAAGESTVLTGNSRGLMNIWDVRSTDGKAVETFMLMDQEEVNATCIGRHPTQGHVIIVGHRDGSLSVWDLRKLDTPEAVLAGDDTAVNELHFNENYPNHLVTCTEGGDLWHWDVSAAGGRHTGVSFQEHEVTPWLQVSTENFSVQELLPNIILGINSLSIAGSRVICGTDDEAIYIVDNIKF